MQMGVPLQELQSKITSSEFVEYMAYLSYELTTPTKEDYYLSQIASEVRRGWVAKPRDVKLDDFILRFDREKEKIYDWRASYAQAVKWAVSMGAKPPEGN